MNLLSFSITRKYKYLFYFIILQKIYLVYYICTDTVYTDLNKDCF